MTMAVELITVSEYARRRGCDEKAVRKAIDERRITAIEQSGRRMIDPAVADIQWQRNTRARADSRASGGTGTPGGNGAAASGGDQQDYFDHRARRERAEALRAELQAGRLAGALVERARVEAVVFDAFRQLRDSLQNLGLHAASAVVGKSDAKEVQQLIDGEIRRALDAFEQRLPDTLRRVEP